MRLQVLWSSPLLVFPACQLAGPSHFECPEIQPANPQLSLTYKHFAVKDIPSGIKRVRVWIPAS